MAKEGAMKYGDIIMLWGMIFTMMGLLSIIQMGIMEGLPGFILTGGIFVGIGIIVFFVLILVDRNNTRKEK